MKAARNLKIAAVSRADEPAALSPNKYSGAERIRILETLERKILWLSSWTIHNANHIRPSRDGLKVGGHQASSASMATVMTALYLDILRPQDRVAIKPHASPIFHAIQYLMGKQTKEKLERFRAMGGVQSYPSRTKDTDDIDFGGGSVGLPAVQALFASFAQDYLRLKGMIPSDKEPGRMIAIVGDAELDEGNMFEGLLEGWKHDVHNAWWIIDYNRQSLDSIVTERLFQRIGSLFEMMDWRVVTLKYGKKLQAAFAGPDGKHLEAWIDNCHNSLYSALVYKGGPGWREHLTRDIGNYPGIRKLLAAHDDDALHGLITNLGGHCMESILDAFHGVTDDKPTCFIAYTVKGKGLPFAGHKDNHSGLMNKDQMNVFRAQMKVGEGEEWDHFAGLDMPEATLRNFLAQAPFYQTNQRQFEAEPVAIPVLPTPKGNAEMSTQDGFGKILNELAGGDSELAASIVTTSPDVTVSTNLGAWVNRRGIFHRNEVADVFRDHKVVSAQKWAMAPGGQHIELGIAEHNLFLVLSAFGLTAPLFGKRLLPVGTVYDPFINRGLDALIYGCYQDARFMIVATPSGLALAPEGGAHQSINTPLIGMAQDGLAYYEPAYVDELAVIMGWGFAHMQKPYKEGGSVYLRLSTRAIAQPQREITENLRADIISGAYWLVEPAPGAKLAIVYCGNVVEEAKAAHATLLEDEPGAGLLAITSPDRLHADWIKHRQGDLGQSRIERLLSRLAPDAGLVTIMDGHPASLSWIGGAGGLRIQPLGVDHYGQCGDIPDLFAEYGIDEDAILNAAARIFVGNA